MSKKSRIHWFRLNRELHRDLGYLVIGLTLVFAISGLALNHIHDWNPNYSVERQVIALSTSVSPTDATLTQYLTESLALSARVKASYWESPIIFKLFLSDGSTVTADLMQHEAVYEQLKPRPLLRDFIQLHLNEVRQSWVIVSDIYAVILLYMALSALFMVKGQYSPWRARRGWLVLAGFLIPSLYIFI